MIQIGICDDVKEEREKIHHLCEEFFADNEIEYSYVFFESGEEVLEYCADNTKEQINLLFLDIEMGGISGIELKDKVMKLAKIWRIVFVTSHIENALAGYSIKTMGFIKKPATKEEVFKHLYNVIEEWRENLVFEFKGYHNTIIYVRLEDIAYFSGARSYAKIFTYKEDSNEVILSKSLSEIESELKGYSFVRPHKSYLVNLANITDIEGEEVTLKDLEVKIPIGRSHKKDIRRSYLMYGKNRVIKRL